MHWINRHRQIFIYMGPCIMNQYLITVQQDATQKTIVYLLLVCLTSNPKLRSTEVLLYNT